MSSICLQVPLPRMTLPDYNGHHSDSRQYFNNLAHWPGHQTLDTPSRNSNDGQGQSQTQLYVAPRHGNNSDRSSVGYSYNATPQPGYSQYQRSPYSPYQTLAPPVYQLPPGSSGYMSCLPPKNASASASDQGQNRKFAPIKRTTSSKRTSSPTNAEPQTREKWRWDIPDEVYARMNSEEKKQVRNRCGARTFRAKRKGKSFPNSWSRKL